MVVVYTSNCKCYKGHSPDSDGTEATHLYRAFLNQGKAALLQTGIRHTGTPILQHLLFEATMLVATLFWP